MLQYLLPPTHIIGGKGHAQTIRLVICSCVKHIHTLRWPEPRWIQRVALKTVRLLYCTHAPWETHKKASHCLSSLQYSNSRNNVGITQIYELCVEVTFEAVVEDFLSYHIFRAERIVQPCPCGFTLRQTVCRSKVYLRSSPCNCRIFCHFTYTLTDLLTSASYS